MQNIVFLHRAISKPIIFLSFFSVISLISFGTVSANPSILKGKVIDENNQPLQFTTVYFKENNRATTTDYNGKFILKTAPGEYTLIVTNIGFKTYEKTIILDSDKPNYLTVVMKKEISEIDEVEIKGKSITSRINTSAYNVEALNATLLHNTTLDVSQALDKISGVNIRITGGVGSNNEITLNGFSGKHVKLFMDGIPMQGAGSSMNLSKLPINMIDRIDVYKGVVPIEFGSDALGGVINIVTKQSKQTFVDVSYSYGSFNTHKSNINFGHTTRKGIMLQFDAYQNYSDNNYSVLTTNLDLETNTYSTEENWYKRLHDTYHNEAVVGRIGVRDKKWATRFFIEATYSQEHKDVQNSNLQQVVFGMKEASSTSIIPALNYLKKDLFTENLDLSIAAKYNKVETHNLDTASRRYNWAGEWVSKSTAGESSLQNSLQHNNTAQAVANLRYSIADKHYFSLNNTFSDFQRESEDLIDASTSETGEMKRINRKNITGFSYRY